MDGTDLDRAKRASVLLVSCLVKALDEADSTLQSRFIRIMHRASRNIRHSTQDPATLQDLEVLDWARDLLRASEEGGRGAAWFLQED